MKALAALTIALLIVGCNEEQERFENILKLRAIGVNTEPAATAPQASAGKTWKLTAYFAVPTGAAITSVTNFDDPTDPQSQDKVTVTPDALGADRTKYCDAYNNFDICRVTATAPIPTADQVVIRPDIGYVRMRYGIKLATATEEQTVVGALLIYPEGAPQLTQAAPLAIDITTPASGSTVTGKPDLKASLNESLGEHFRIGWYTSGGNIDNRRAIETTWSKLPDAGQATVLVTVRGTDNGAFALKAVNVTVE